MDKMPHSKVKTYFIEHMGGGSYSTQQMFDMYMELMRNDNIITTYKPMKKASLYTILSSWAREKDGFLIKKGMSSGSAFTQRVEQLPDISSYTEGLSFCEPKKLSKKYGLVNRILCGLLRKEHRDGGS